MREKISKEKKVYVLVVLYTLLLFSLNFIRIFDNNFWGDEAFTIKLAGMDFVTMLQSTAADVHPPLYYAIVQLLYRILGNNGYTFHLSALVPYVIILFVALTRIKERFGIQTSIIFITFSSILPKAINYNVEARMYTWGGLFVTLSFLELYEILIENKNRNYVGFVLASLAAAYTHYYCLISVAFFYIVLIAIALVKQKEYIKKVIIICIVTVLGYLPWLFALLKSFHRVSGSYWMKNVPQLRYCIAYLFDCNNYFKYVFFLIMLIACFIVILQEIKMLEVIKNLFRYSFKEVVSKIVITENTVWLFTAFLSIFGTMIVGIFVSILIRPMFITRYLYPVAYIAWLICGFAISKFKYRNIYTGILLTLILVVCIPEYKECYTQEKIQNHVLEETLDKTKEITEGDVILTNIDHVDWTIADYYYPGVEQVYFEVGKIPELAPKTQYWMVISESIDDTTLNCLEEDYIIDIVVNNGILGTHSVYIYKLSYME